VSSLFNGAFDAAAGAWWQWSLPIATQVALIAVVAALIDVACSRRSRPRLQTLLWTAVLVKFFIPPWFSSPVSVMRLLAAPPLAESQSTIEMTWVRAISGAWLAGVVLIACFALVRHRIACVALSRETRPATDLAHREIARAAQALGLRRVPETRIVPRAIDAAVFGFVRPVILVPADLLRGDPERLRHVLLHECAHLRRRDHWWSLLIFVIAALAWCHPASWFARSRLTSLREISCDEMVARTLGDGGRAYRATLASIARVFLDTQPGGARHIHRGLVVPYLLWPGSSLLVARLRHLQREIAPRSARHSACLAGVALVMAASVLPLANPPLPRDEQWAAAQGCMQKRTIIWQMIAERDASSSLNPSPLK